MLALAAHNTENTHIVKSLDYIQHVCLYGSFHRILFWLRF